MREIELDPTKVTGKEARALIKASNGNDREKVASIAQRMFKASVT
jgi:hypothetical protein